MKEYNVRSDYNSESIEEVLSDLFEGEVKKQDDTYRIKCIGLEIVDNITVEDVDRSVIKLDISHKSLDEIDNLRKLDESVPRCLKFKNQLLRRITGFTVEDRKRKMRKEVLPDSELVDV